MTTIDNAEIAAHWDWLQGTIDRFLAICDETDGDGLRWRAPAPDTNSIAILAIHTLGNIEESLIETLGGEPVGRDRDAEFVDRSMTAAAIHERWSALRPRLEATLAGLDPAELERERTHPRRGMMSGRGVLLLVARHAAEHLGHAELTRDLWNARAAAGSDG